MSIGGFIPGQVESGGLLRSLARPKRLSIMVGGTDLTGSLIEKSLSLTSTLTGRTTGSVRLRDRARTYSIAVGKKVEIREYADLIFAGSVESRGRTLFGKSGQLIHDLQCVDFNQLADRRRVVEEFDNMTAGDIIRAIASKYLGDEGLTTNGVQDGPLMTRQRFPNFEHVAEAFDEIAQQVGFSWYIDERKDLKFFDRLTYSAPWAITDSSRPYVSLETVEERGQYRNRQYMRGGKAASDTTFTKVIAITAENRSGPWEMDYDLALEPSIVVNGGVRTVGIQDQAKRGFYWQRGSNRITSDNDITNLLPGEQMVITYKGLVGFLIIKEDKDEIEARQAVEGGTGVWEGVEEDEKIDTLDLGIERAEGMLRQFARIPVMATIETDTPGIRPGMLQSIQDSQLGLDGDFLVQSVKVKDLGRDQLRYSYDVVDGEATGQWVQFWRNVARAGRKFIINENDTLQAGGLLTETMVLTDHLEQEDGNQLAFWQFDQFIMQSGGRSPAIYPGGLSGFSRSGRPTYVT